ncbi:kinase-like domain-containing protein [Bisporella sp. PMI_857]|nr:kinase-like domain-containing protein [Bisporella sp. PMI_857]
MAYKVELRLLPRGRTVWNRQVCESGHLTVPLPSGIEPGQARLQTLTLDNIRQSIVSEEGCFGSSFERKYYKKAGIFVRRSLRESEYRTGINGLYVPKLPKERLRNEAESLIFVRESTNVPVPQLYHHFEHDGAYYIAMEYVKGVCMSKLSEDQKRLVGKEIEIHLSTMHNLKSNKIGGPSGIIIPPCRVIRKIENEVWNIPTKDYTYVFYHMDIYQQNVIVDPKTLKINAIIDFEYSGFWPEKFEQRFYTRLGPTIAREGEIDDTLELIRFLTSHLGLQTFDKSHK